jgi:hypothetical protein
VPAHVALVGTEPEVVPAAEVEETATAAEAESLEPVAVATEVEVAEASQNDGTPAEDEQPTAAADEPGEDENSAS